MPAYQYLIVGGGMTADAAVEGIREVDPAGSIGLIGEESHQPYDRPPLSKGLWKDKQLESIWRKSAAREAALHLGRKVVTLDPSQKTVRDDRGTVYRYEKLLLATGGEPNRLRSDPDSVLYFRTLNDYRCLRRLTQERKRFVVIGGGFIGSEIAAALKMNGCDVAVVFPQQGIGGRLFPPDLAQSLNDFYRDKGVEVYPGERVEAVERRGSNFVVKTRSGRGDHQREIVAEAVVAGLGIRPNVELACAAGLGVNNGICVNSALRTSNPDVFAAGDVAEFHNPALRTCLRVEHEDNANTMGAAAGRSMAGEHVSYDHISFFYSDLFELGYEAVGDVDSRLETVAEWREPYREGVVYYLREGRVRGVLLWNVWGQVDAARELIKEAGPFQAEDLEGRLLQVHEAV
jgi:3-phenylpropionate/trans-cinnamate dioxygenase ferredoxin reductase component